MGEVPSLVTVEATWRQVDRIPFGRVIADDRDSLLEFVEEPFREAIGMMFDKNVPTIGSSCNVHDYFEGEAWINIDYDFLVARNKEVVDRHETQDRFSVPNKHLGKLVTVAALHFPIERHEFPADIGKRALSLAEQFLAQPNLLPGNI